MTRIQFLNSHFVHFVKIWEKNILNAFDFFSQSILMKISMLMFLNDVVLITVYSNALWVNGAKNTVLCFKHPDFHIQK